MSWITPVTPSVVTDAPPRIIHVDINSYFATILQQENPALRGKPVGVLKASGRSCVIACSKEAKKLGVQTGCRVKDAKILAPNIILVPAAFDIYLACTQRLKSLFRSLCPTVDIFSLDEAFMDITNDEKIHPDAHAFARSVQAKIKESLGEWVTCNVGISHNHLLSKLASEIAPKGTVSEITETNLDYILSTVSFAQVCGIGYRLEQKLRVLGVTNPYAINFLDDHTLHTHFGPFWAVELKKIARGEEPHFFTRTPKKQHMQSVGRTITGYSLAKDPRYIEQTLRNLLEEATRKLREMNLSGQAFGVSLSGRDRHWGKYKKLSYFVRHSNDIFFLIQKELEEFWKSPFPVIMFGVWVVNLRPTDTIPECWLPSWGKNERLYEMIDAVNHKFGLFALKPASLTNYRMIKPEVTGFLGDKIYYGLE